MRPSQKPHPSIVNLDDAIPLSQWAKPAITILRKSMVADIAHDEAHLVRVLRNALWFSECEMPRGDIDVIVPAAILHDLVNLPKNSPERHLASTLSAGRAVRSLEDFLDFKSEEHKQAIHLAIAAHSFSANIAATTVEARALQDADRLDALGAIGLGRLFGVTGALGRTLFHPTDPLAENRDLDEMQYGLDHFAIKLAHIHYSMKTAKGRDEAAKRTGLMISFIRTMINEAELVGEASWRHTVELDDRIDNFITKGGEVNATRQKELT